MAESPFSHIRISRYFTLYFIPLFPTSTLGEFVRCGGCNGDFTEAILKYTREEILLSMQPWVCKSCNNHNSNSNSNCLSCGAGKAVQPPALPPPLPLL